MKIPVLIITILITQVSASFFDVFQGAVLSVQNSFGKLLTDVVTDVRDTVDCTILALEHVLSLSEDATAQYYKKCGNGNKTESVGGRPQDGGLPKVEISLEISNKGDNFQKGIPVEIDAKINETLSKVLGNYNPHNNLLSVENVLAKEKEQLADVSKLVKQELKKLSNEVHTDLKNTKLRDSDPSVDTILQEIKLLENKEQNTKNTSEATEIHQVIDEVLAKLNVIEVTEATENMKLDDILRTLEKNSNNSFIGLRHQFQDWKEEESRHLAEIKNKIEEHEKNASLHDYIYESHGSNYSQPVSNAEKVKNIVPLGPTEKPLHTETVLQKSIKNGIIEPTKLSAKIKYMLDSATETVNTTNEVLLTSIKKEATTVAYTMIDQPLNYTTATSTAFKRNTFMSTLDLENTTATIVENIEPLTLVSDDHSVIRNNTVTSTIFPTVDDGTVRLLETTMHLKNQDSSLTTRSAPSTVMENPNENVLNETVTGNLGQRMEITSVDNGTVRPVETKMEFKNQDSLLTTSTPTSVMKIPNENDLIETVTGNSVKEMETTSIHSGTVQPVETIMDFKNQDSVLTTSAPTTVNYNVKIINDDDLNKSLTGNSIQILESTSIGTVLQPVGINTNINEEKLSTVTTNKAIATSSVANIISKIETNFPSPFNGTEAELTLTTPISSNTDILNAAAVTDSAITILETTTYKELLNLNSNELTSTPALLLSIEDNITESGTILSVENKTASWSEESSTITMNEVTSISRIGLDSDSNDTIITKMLSPIVPNTSINKTFQTLETIAVSGNGESTAAAINNFTTSAVSKDNDLYDNVATNNPLSFISTLVTDDIIQIAETTVASTMEASLTTNIPISTSNFEIIEDPSVTLLTSSLTSTLRSLLVENTTSADDKESSTMTTHLMTDNDPDDAVITSTSLVTLEATPINEITFPDKSTTSIDNDGPSTLTTTQTVDIPKKIKNYNNDQDDAVTTTHLITEGGLVSTNNQAEATGTNLISQELASTSDTTTTSTAFTLTETTPIIRETILPIKSTTRNTENRDTLTANSFLPTPKIYNIVNLNHAVTNRPTLAITEGPFMKKNIPFFHRPINPENRAWLPPMQHENTPRKLNQQIYPNTKRVPRNNYDPNIPQSLRDRDSHLFPIRNSKMPARNLYQNPYFAPTMKKADAPRRHEGRNNEKPPYVHIPKNRIHPPYSWDDRAANTYRSPKILPTYRPMTTVPRKVNNNYKPSSDYDSFFHSPQTNNEAHQRALREARELIEKSKRAHRIIDTVLKNRNHYGARSIFNKPGTINKGVG